jgi:6-pyruvoyltetrahydropterin/6-carboxytetrahydropterin synthase
MTKRPQGYGSAVLSFTFEAAHRQPEVGGKCFNMHGHSWDVGVMLYNNSYIGGVNELGLSVEFGEAKRAIRGWIDHHFDHATLLGVQDTLLEPLRLEGCKVFTFGEDGDYEPIAWPSVEAVAFCLGDRLQDIVTQRLGRYASIETVTVSETCTNSFTWWAPHAHVREY